MVTTIGLDLLFVEPGRTGGMETYVRRLIPLLPSVVPDARFVAFGGRELYDEWRTAPWHSEIDFIPIPVSAGSRGLRTAMEMTFLEAKLRSAGVDLVHGLGNVIPLGPGLRRVITVYDCIYFTHPETTSPLLALGMRNLIRAGVRRADRVIAVSESTARDLRAILGVDAEKIDVVLAGPGADPEAVPTPENELRHRLGIPNAPVVLAVSARRPHKNLERLIEAMVDVPDACLVLPGYPTAFDDGLRQTAHRLELDDRVVFCGWVDAPDLEGLYATAACVVMPSLVEGFGLPLLEAMARGVPVVASDIPVFREVGGAAPIYVDPSSTSSIANGLRTALVDSSVQEQTVARGHDRVLQFSWEAAAAGTARAYARAWAQS